MLSSDCEEGPRRSPKPSSCRRKHKTIYFTPEVSPGTEIQVRLRRPEREQLMLSYVVEDGGSELRISDDAHALFRKYHTDKGGEMELQFNYHGKSYTWGRFKECSENTPIGLDVDQSGAVERVQGDFMFDITGDGDLEHLHEWFAPTEGILLDAALAMKDGIVTTQHFLSSTASADSRELAKHSGAVTGKHLFGDMGSLFEDGYEKLAAIKDGDHDGLVSGAELDGLAIWVDSNSNSKVDAGELNSLMSYGIVALSTTPDSGSFVSHAQLKDGSTMLVEDLFFA